MTVLCIISCGSAKLKYPTTAHRLYTGGYFKMQLAWARSHYPASRIRILSAKHGLLKLTDKIAPYSLRMGQPGSIPAEIIAQQLPPNTHIVTTCGDAYLEPLQTAAHLTGCTISTPFHGYPWIGPKMQAIKRATRPGRKI